MAKAIATIGGVALKPGVSRNRRWYTREHIAAAVAGAQERIRAGNQPMVMLTHHDAGDDSTRIAARLTGMSLGEDGSARYTAEIADTAAGRDIASLVDRSGGEPHLKGVSIRGYWTGTVRKIKGPDGADAEQGQGLLLDGLDFTRSPGVSGAGVDTFAWAKRAGRSETTERVLITESVREARVTITEETAAARKAAKKAAKRAAREAAVVAAVAQVLQERRVLAAQFSEAGLSKALRESSDEDLAVISMTAQASHANPASRPVVNLDTFSPRSLDDDELALATLAGSAGSAPFFATVTTTRPRRGGSPFHTYRPTSGFSMGVDDA